MIYLQVAAGLVLLLVGGEYLVRGAVAVARRLGISPLVIGLTLVGFGTSTPELVASLEAALTGVPGVAVGNVVGSNIANILLILGISAVLKPIACDRQAFLRDGTVLVCVSGLGVAACLSAVIGMGWGLFLIALLGAYTGYTYLTERGGMSPEAAVHKAEADSVQVPEMPIWKGLTITALGLAGILIGAALLVDGAVVIARAFGVSEAVIGLTLVALGTSLPELATSIMASLRGQADVAFGNVIGSNIFNILGILGVTAIVTPIPVAPEIMAFDVWVMAGVSLLLVAFAVTGWRINRWEGLLFLFGYIAYISVQFVPAMRSLVGLA